MIITCLSSLATHCPLGCPVAKRHAISPGQYIVSDGLPVQGGFMSTPRLQSSNVIPIMTSSNRNIFRVAGLVWRESTGHRWISLKKPVTRSFDVSLICAWTNDWVKNQDVGDLSRHRAHYDVTVMQLISRLYWEFNMIFFNINSKNATPLDIMMCWKFKLCYI